MISDDATLEGRRRFLPFRAVIDFSDVDSSNHTKLLATGIVFSVNLSFHLSKKVGQKVNVVYGKTVQGSVDHRGYVELDFLDGIATAHAQILATKWLANEIFEMLSEKHRGCVLSALVTVGIIRIVADESELTDADFLNLEAHPQPNSTFEMPEVGIVETATKKKAVSGKSRIALGATGAVLIVAWIGATIFQIIEGNEKARRFESKIDALLQNGIDPDTDDTGAPPSLPISIRIEIVVDSAAPPTEVSVDSNVEGLAVEQFGTAKVIRVPG